MLTNLAFTKHTYLKGSEFVKPKDQLNGEINVTNSFLFFFNDDLGLLKSNSTHFVPIFQFSEFVICAVFLSRSDSGILSCPLEERKQEAIVGPQPQNCCSLAKPAVRPCTTRLKGRRVIQIPFRTSSIGSELAFRKWRKATAVVLLSIRPFKVL